MSKSTAISIPVEGSNTPTPATNAPPAAPAAPSTTAAKPLEELSDNTAIRIYRIGIGEAAFIPLQPVISETVKMQNEIDSSLYAKTNPLISYTNTIRTFKFDSIVPYDAANFTFRADESSGLADTNSYELMDLYTLLRSFLYANYEVQPFDKNNTADGIVARTIKSPPLFKVKFKNFISYTSDGTCPPGAAKKVGLLGTFSDFKVEPVFVGNYIPWSSNMTISRGSDKDSATAITLNGDNGAYQKLQISFTFVPISQQPLGWQNDLTANKLTFGGINELIQSVASENAITKILKGNS